MTDLNNEPGELNDAELDAISGGATVLEILQQAAATAQKNFERAEARRALAEGNHNPSSGWGL